MKYNSGDMVLIKSWDEMVSEYGFDGYHIPVSDAFLFYGHFKPYCGNVFIIDDVYEDCYTFKEANAFHYFTDEMIECVVDVDFTKNIIKEVEDEIRSRG